jgi:hypothetical protein
MYGAYSSMRHILISDGRVANLVTNIKVGYQNEVNTFPSISIFRIGGSSVGNLGYGTSSVGSKDREQVSLFQIDIFSNTSIEELELIDDAVIKAIMSGVAYGVGVSMSNNPGVWDDSFQSYRLTQTWRYSELKSD